MSVLHAGSHRLLLSRPRIVGVVNVTPDSFSDGGQLHDTQAAIAHALKLNEQGADILDVGGESTRPGATAVPVDEEIGRVVPVIEALAREGCLVSVDTRKPEVMRAALAAGAGMVNDVAALRASGAMEAVAASGAAVCLMHMQGDPQSMQQSPRYADVVDEVKQFLRARVQVCEAAGIARERLVIDPGFGFGKTLQHNLALLKHLGELAELDVPILAGLSRKSMLGTLTGRVVDEREFAGVAAHLMAVAQGARLLRVHNVMAMRDALAIWNAVEEYGDGT
ncbi:MULTISPECIES: dihydropteroate synthase [unclassified Thiobacillus]|uniref:dihydropteroate synthase n=1 Tax=unclassified Thiobacillus TaxID=2646513 RepID=UPI00086E27DF|nr:MULTISPECIES: dihydropteroate synthase [unclassified Thiobacillus]MBN8779852.1 dihydropteroate synthase [Thiobacillus sp.]MBS0328777.1 dihydropteroate synthase [Pseudomonadota bacterium]ODV03160.1 MAG: dihydropteroate synthase [Thiobacillus sp. SCN 63-57]